MGSNTYDPATAPSALPRGGTVLDGAHAELRAVLDQLINPEPGVTGVAHYAHDPRDAYGRETFMVAGGGPSAWVEFTPAGAPTSAKLAYHESGGYASVPVPDEHVGPLYAALRAYGH